MKYQELHRKMQAMGRQELANPVAEAMRKVGQSVTYTCEDCEYCCLDYPIEGKDWCDKSDTEVRRTNESCDNIKIYEEV